MKNFEKIANVAFYDSVKNNDILTNIAQASKWSKELHKEGVQILYIKSLNDAYYKQVFGCPIEAISQSCFESEWKKLNCEQEILKKEKKSEDNQIKTINESSNYQEFVELNEDKIRLIVRDEFKKIINNI